ncbi:MAG TPA: diacylglycerol kinase family protein [Alphaproteobacteria bacterium]|nr:diacylglycerol kinase family protein [Alphaproteobacteria bacterium]
MRAIAIINEEAGSSLGYDRDSLKSTITETFQAEGMTVDLWSVPSIEIEEALRAAAKSDVPLLVAGGGDGTINTAASYAMKHDKTLGILPMGTLNRLANDLRIPLDLREAIRVIARGERHRIDAAEVNGHLFFCNSFFGLPAIFAETRAELRGRPLLHRLRGYLYELPRSAFAARRIVVAIDDGTEKQMIRGLAFAVSNNPYVEEDVLTLRRGALNQGKLGFYASKHYSVFGVIWLLIKVLFGFWNKDPYFFRKSVETVQVRSKRSRIKLTNDGEVMRLQPPLNYSVHPAAVSIVLPGQS